MNLPKTKRRKQQPTFWILVCITGLSFALTIMGLF